jgi:hypothetical protein
VILAVGLADQSVTAKPLNAAYRGIAEEVRELRVFVGELERKLPAGSQVLQLPFTTYLNDSGRFRMRPYDHMKLYLLSHQLRWSYPALSNPHVRWQQAASRLPLDQLPGRMAAEGFAAIVLDRYGYEDGGVGVVDAVQNALPTEPLLATSARYVALDLRGVPSPETWGSAEWSVMPPTSAGLPPCAAATLASVDRIAETTAPFGPYVPIGRASSFRVVGWAVDQSAKTVASGLDVVVNGAAFPAFYGFERPDVVASLRSPAFFASGFVADISTIDLGPGRHSLQVRAISSTGGCYYAGREIAFVIK